MFDYVCECDSDEYPSAHPYEEPAYKVYKMEDF